jgi:uncharacterized DUF497 family protein
VFREAAPQPGKAQLRLARLLFGCGDDPYPHLDGPDLQHSAREVRFRRLGRSAEGRVLMVVYTQRRTDDAETIRIISARCASRQERNAYAQAED